MAPRSPGGRATGLPERDRTAWEQVYRDYEERLYRFAYRLTGNEHDAADLVQETFVRVLARLDRIDRERPDLSSYLFKTAQNLFLRGRERASRVQMIDEVPEPHEPSPIDDDPQRATLLHRQQEEVREANDKLAPRQRLVLSLCELEDRSYAEIGAIVGLNENAVAQLISRARQRLRHELRLVQVERSRLPEACQRLLPHLSSYLDGQLKGTTKDEVLLHVATCAHCQQALADMEEARRRYRTLIPPLAAGGALEEAIGDAGAAEYLGSGDAGAGAPSDGPLAGAARGGRLAGRPRGWLLAAAAGVVAALATGGAHLGLAGGDSPQPAAVVETLPATTAAPAPADDPVEPAATAPADTLAPSVTILNGPPKETRSHRASFAFESSEPAGGFVCSLDGAGWSQCSSAVRYERLGAGPHLFRVVATDVAGNESPPAVWRWTVLQRPSAPQAGGAEGASGKEAPPASTETASPPGAPTEEPKPHEQPEDEDPEPAEAEPADTIAPSIVGLSAPESPTRKTTAAFRWSTSEPVSRVECSLDGGGFARCYTPKGYSELSVGGHRFCVRAVDRASNVGAPFCLSWVIEEKPDPAPKPEPKSAPEPPPSPQKPEPADPPASAGPPWTDHPPGERPPNDPPSSEPRPADEPEDGERLGGEQPTEPELTERQPGEPEPSCPAVTGPPPPGC